MVKKEWKVEPKTIEDCRNNLLGVIKWLNKNNKNNNNDNK